jgi:acetyl esterase/lipase
MRYAWMSLVVAAVVVVCAGCSGTKGQAREQSLWPGGVKDGLIVHKLPETTVVRDDKKTPGLNRAISSIGEPTMTIYKAPKDLATRAGVVIFPGGAYRRVAIDHEGHDVARRLNQMGITAMVVKYRTLPVEPNGRAIASLRAASFPGILADGKQAIRVMRSRAPELGVDPNKVGVMGFSAGGHLSLSIMLGYDPNAPADVVSCQPDFACLVYPGGDDEMVAKVRAGMPPCFFVVAADDRLAEGTCKMFAAMLKAKDKAELNVYQSGGHGFGLGRTKGTESTWPDSFAVWLKQNKFSR